MSDPAGPNDSDPLLLQPSTQWAADAADLRQQISDYFGPGSNALVRSCGIPISPGWTSGGVLARGVGTVIYQ